MSRAISEEFLADLKGGKLGEISEAVRRDDTLLLALRGNSINIYYRGGSLLRLLRINAGHYTAFFDTNYARETTLALPILPQTVADRVDCIAWVQAFPHLKEVMNSFLSKHPKTEREFQQLVAWENNRSAIANGTEYFITDIEYADTELNARLDMLGFKWLSTDRRNGSRCSPVFIEMKYGIGAYEGNSGIEKHIADLSLMLGDPAKKAILGKTIADQFSQLDELGLLRFNRSRAFEGIEVSGRPEVILLLANHNPRSSKLLNALQSIEEPRNYDLRFFVACFAGYGLHAACMLTLDQFRAHLRGYRAEEAASGRLAKAE